MAEWYFNATIVWMFGSLSISPLVKEVIQGRCCMYKTHGRAPGAAGMWHKAGISISTGIPPTISTRRHGTTLSTENLYSGYLAAVKCYCHCREAKDLCFCLFLCSYSLTCLFPHPSCHFIPVSWTSTEVFRHLLTFAISLASIPRCSWSQNRFGRNASPGGLAWEIPNAIIRMSNGATARKNAEKSSPDKTILFCILLTIFVANGWR